MNTPCCSVGLPSVGDLGNDRRHDLRVSNPWRGLLERRRRHLPTHSRGWCARGGSASESR
jgi:hypothetical protein